MTRNFLRAFAYEWLLSQKQNFAGKTTRNYTSKLFELIQIWFENSLLLLSEFMSSVLLSIVSLDINRLFFSSLLSQWENLNDTKLIISTLLDDDKQLLISDCFRFPRRLSESSISISDTTLPFADFFSIFHSCVVAVVCRAASVFRPSSCVLLTRHPTTEHVGGATSEPRTDKKIYCFHMFETTAEEMVKRRAEGGRVKISRHGKEQAQHTLDSDVE